MSFLCDDRGVSTTFSYILIAGISILFFSIVILTYSTVLINAPTNLAVLAQYNDVGNEVGSKIVDIYVIAPENGTLDTKLTLPDKLGGDGYSIEFTPTGTDQEIRVASLDNKREVRLTLNGVSQTVNLSGVIHKTGDSNSRDDYGIKFTSE